MTSLLERAAEVYGGIHSYTDQGVTTEVLTQGEDRTMTRMTFRTAFVRPDRFRYEFKNDLTGERLVIRQENAEAKVFWSGDGQVTTTSFPLAMARATGVSRGTAVLIPHMLLPGLIQSWGLTDMEDAKESGEEVLAGVRCLRIDGFQSGSPVAVWLDCQDLLVRRVLQTRRFGREARAAVLAVLPEEFQGTDEMNLLDEPDFETETDTLFLPGKNVALGENDFGPVEDE
jgi:hypothetical protein